MTVKIYTLADPRSGLVRYVGKTITTLDKRLKSHLRSPRYRKNHRTNWIKSLIDLGLIPAVELIDEVDDSVWQIAERNYITLFKSYGADLVNQCIGGVGMHGYKHSEETKAKMRNPNKKGIQRKYKSRNEANKAHSKYMKENFKSSGLGTMSKEKLMEVLKLANANSVASSHKEVVELDQNGNIINEFYSVAETARQTGLIDSNIACVCRGTRKHTGKRVFKYKKDMVMNNGLAISSKN